MKAILFMGLLLLAAAAAVAQECVPVSSWVAAPARRVDAEAVLAAAAGKSAVLLGEEHDRAEHHRWQLHTLAALHARRPQLVLGFEMFPRRVQGALDRWVAGELSDAEFLAAADWRKVWNMDPALYLPLFHFARMHRVPMVALDVEREQRAAAAPAFAPPSEGYVAMLKEVYAQHPQGDFQRFVDSQARHDRVMAQSIADALAARPGALLVGILGRGHVVHGYGVPHQLGALGVRDVAVLLPWDRDRDCRELVAGVADAVFGVASREEPRPPRLGISLDGARIAAVEEGSIAEQAELRAGDVLVEIAGRPVTQAGDVAEAVQRQAPGTWLPLKVRRGPELLERVARFPPVALHYDLDVRLDPAAGTLEGRARISRPGKLVLGPGFTMEAGAGGEVRWRGELEQAAFLPGEGGWYPRIAGALATYSVTLELPAGHVGLVPGTLVEESHAGGKYRARFLFAAPGEALDLMTGPYQVDERAHRGAGGRTIRLRTYFHPQIAALSAGYLDAAAGYLDLYEKRIGDYPFDSFSIVSSPTPTGYGMASLTYLGIDVLRLPFIRATSLGHEVLHNWWGNGVYIDSAQGNWAEGLTTFMADYAYREREGAAAAREMRLAWLRDVTAVAPEKEAPLTAFRGRTHASSQILGYRKAGMLFVMLRDAIGAEAFERALRQFWRAQRFRPAAWSDLQRAFEAASGTDLSAFFSQWLSRPGAPRIEIVAASGTSVTLAQDAAAPFTVRVPVLLDAETTEVLELSQARQTFTLKTAPKEIALDPDLRVLRRLLPDEAPPILRGAMVAPTPAFHLLDESLRAAGQALAAKLFDHPPGEGEPTLVIGRHAEVDTWLAARGLRRPPGLGHGTAQAWMQPEAKAPLAVISVRDAAALAALARPLPHYGAQSFVVFDGAKAIERGVWPSRPQTVRVGHNR